ncbi:carboxylesterase/lipase family protein [Streptomyces sp. NPDC051677]|uniref:carboxylesterase/lipase family protein n=1 Tax=Streptomyces sp. NPDC051677 TaxID=3365669 RepID=UPI0037D07B7A
METRDSLKSFETEVRTQAGRVRGRQEGGLAVFRGIPFAEPPVGDARFQAPRTVRGWDGIREAFSFGPPPPQDPTMPMVAAPPDSPTGDDWLTVNVWTPDVDPAARRPVMVWIYGGAFKVGSANLPVYDGSHLARDGDLVVVTFNYRVGVEGFSYIEGAPANRGLLDQVAALEWVRDNIVAFGGDPDQVTVFGESAGAGSVAALLAMPRATGLFRRAIAQSVPSVLLTTELARDMATTIADGLGLRPTVADLSTVDPGRLRDAGTAVSTNTARFADRWGQAAHAGGFAAVVDGEVLPTTPWEALAGGAGREVELIVGHNRDEVRVFLALDGRLGTIGDDDAAGMLRALGPGPDSERAYRTAFPEASSEKLYELVQSDWLFRMPSLHLAEAQVAGGGRAHMYELPWPAPVHGGLLGACHGLDMPLVFGTLDTAFAKTLLGPEPSPDAQALSHQFMTSWTAFAATGDPGWPAYDPQQRLVRIFDTNPAVTPYPGEASRRVWQNHTFSALPLLISSKPQG